MRFLYADVMLNNEHKIGWHLLKRKRPPPCMAKAFVYVRQLVNRKGKEKINLVDPLRVILFVRLSPIFGVHLPFQETSPLEDGSFHSRRSSPVP